MGLISDMKKAAKAGIHKGIKKAKMKIAEERAFQTDVRKKSKAAERRGYAKEALKISEEKGKAKGEKMEKEILKELKITRKILFELYNNKYREYTLREKTFEEVADDEIKELEKE